MRILHNASTQYLYCCLVSHLPAFVSRSLVAKTLMMFRNNIKLTWRENRNIMTQLSIITNRCLIQEVHWRTVRFYTAGEKMQWACTHHDSRQDGHLIYPFQIASTQVPTPAVDKQHQMDQREINKDRAPRCDDPGSVCSPLVCLQSSPLRNEFNLIQ